jgi:hypothetical protein
MLCFKKDNEADMHRIVHRGGVTALSRIGVQEIYSLYETDLREKACYLHSYPFL